MPIAMVILKSAENDVNVASLDEELVHLLAEEVEAFDSLGLQIESGALSDVEHSKTPSKTLVQDRQELHAQGDSHQRLASTDLQLCVDELIRKRREQQQKEMQESIKQNVDSLPTPGDFSAQSHSGYASAGFKASKSVKQHPGSSLCTSVDKLKRTRRSPSCQQPLPASSPFQNDDARNELANQRNRLIIRRQRNAKQRPLAPRVKSKTNTKRRSSPSLSTKSWFMHPSNQAGRLRWLLQRLEFSCQQMELVFQQCTSLVVQMNSQAGLDPNSDESDCNCTLQAPSTMPTQRPVPYLMHTLAPLRVSPYEHMISLRDSFSGMVGSESLYLDASTFLRVLWLAFSMQTRESVRPPTVNPHFDAAYEKCLMETVVHGTVRYTLTIKHIQMPVKVEAHGVLKKHDNGLVWETVGHMEPDTSGFLSKKHKTHGEEMILSLATMDFSRSTWSRVETVEGGTCVVHHVHRLAPIVNSQTPPALPAGMTENEFRQHQLQILVEMLQIGREETVELIDDLILERFPNKSA